VCLLSLPFAIDANNANSELELLYVIPKHQRQGVGRLLLEDGLKRVDELGFQCVLTASEDGFELYQKVGFQILEEMKHDLNQYAGWDEPCIRKMWVMRRSPYVMSSKYLLLCGCVVSVQLLFWVLHLQLL
jgi:GNAT superfamily N-acetyltransferase